MNAALLVKNYLSIIHNITAELKKLDDFELNYLISQFNLLQKYWLEFTKITDNGKGPSELRTEKLKVLKKWLKEYSDKDQFLTERIPIKYRNKNVAIDRTILDRYEVIADYLVDYMKHLPSNYQELKKTITPLLEIRKELLRNADAFELAQEDLLTSFAARQNKVEDLTDSLIDITPHKTINSIRSILSAYGRFIKRISEIKNQIDPLLEFFTDIDLKEIYGRLNQRNKLIQTLSRNLANVKEIIKDNDFKHKNIIINEYQALLKDFSSYLPSETIATLSSFEKPTSPEEELERSVGRTKIRIKNYDPLTDPEMKWPAPEPKNIKSKPQPQTPPETKPAPLPDEPRIGLPVTPEEKKKYESLWEVAAGNKHKKQQLTRLADYLSIRYTD